MSLTMLQFKEVTKDILDLEEKKNCCVPTLRNLQVNYQNVFIGLWRQNQMVENVLSQYLINIQCKNKSKYQHIVYKKEINLWNLQK